jgi:hypothetical protein
MKHIFHILIPALLALTLLSGCDRRIGHTSSGEKVYGNITLLTESLYEAVEGQNGIGRGDKVNYRNMYYDKDGRLTETVHYWKHQVMQREIFSYAADGRLDGGEVYGFEGAMLGNYSYTYGEDGRVAEQVLTAKDGKVLWRNTYLYDADGNLAELTTHDADGSITARTVTTFDAQGFPTETKTFGPDNRPDKVTAHTYEPTDRKGNWLKRINRRDGKAVSLHEREITY